METLLNIDVDKHIEQLKNQLFTIIDDVKREELLSVSRQFGGLMEYHGKYTYDIKPHPDFLHHYTAKSLHFLYPHLDKYEQDIAPDTVGFYCVQPDKFNEAYTCICDMRPLLESLTEEKLQRLKTKKYSFVVDEGLKAQGFTESCHRPILDYTDPQRPKFRFSFNYTIYDDSDTFIQGFHHRVIEYYKENHLPILLKKNQYLLIRNTLMLHSRTAFRDQNRHLVRVYILDE